jgi:hypothetical protein
MTYIKKGDRVTAQWFDANLVGLAGMQMKVGATARSVTGVIKHFRASRPDATEAEAIFLDPDHWDGPTERPYGCKCPNEHVHIKPAWIISVDLSPSAVIEESTFKVGDIVEVTHPIYNGRGKISQPGWLENIHQKEGEPSHYLVWWIFPETDSDNWPGMIDIIDPKYGIDERGKTMKKVEAASAEDSPR